MPLGQKTTKASQESGMADFIRLAEIYKSFGDLKVLQGVNLTAARGKITVILGRSGGGKSVLLKHIIGLLHPDSGQIWVDGNNLGRLSEMELFELRKRFGFLFQHGALFDSLTVGENVAFRLVEHTSLSAEEIRGIVAQKLAQVGLEGIADKLPGELSGGMLKRVAFARALALDPEVVLFDEPTTGLDPIMTANIIDLISDTVHQSELTVIIISHDLELTFELADSVVFLDQGKILLQAPPEEFRDSDLPQVRQFLEGKPD
jgi:phospholipid/cholesterol/gamma-HCH transport system ATP-binding protein